MTNVNFGDILEGGFRTWKHNFILCIPFLIGMIMSVIVVLLILLPTFFAVFFPLFSQYVTYPTAEQSAQMYSTFMTTFTQNLWLFIGIYALIIILVGLIMSFFTAGAIGMAKQAILTGKTNLNHMVEYGKKKYISYFGASILVGLVMFVGVLLLIPGFIALFSNMNVLIQHPTNPEILSIMYPLIIGGILSLLYFIPVSIILALVPYSVVLDDLKAFDGFYKGIHMFWRNKVNVFIIWLFWIVTLIIAVILAVIPYIGGILEILFLIFFALPVVTIWWSKLYLTLTKPATEPSNAPIQEKQVITP